MSTAVQLVLPILIGGGRLPVELHIFPGPVEQEEKTVDYLVLADTLIAHQEQVFPQQKILQHGLQDYSMLCRNRRRPALVPKVPMLASSKYQDLKFLFLLNSKFSPAAKDYHIYQCTSHIFFTKFLSVRLMCWCDLVYALFSSSMDFVQICRRGSISCSIC